MNDWNWSCLRIMDKAAQYLGIMRKANALAIGEKDSGISIKSGKAFVLCLASDASDNARKRGETFAYSQNVPLIRLPYEKAALQQMFGKTGCSMFCISDLGLASAFVGALAVQDPERYSGAAEALSARQKQSGARGGKGNNGKRRKIV